MFRSLSEKLIGSRGGVEDTRLEAKAKDTKKFQGQGQTLSRPRTKDTDASVLQKKKIFKNFFQAKKVFKKIFLDDIYLRKPKKRSLQIFRKVSGVFQRNFNGSKIVLSSSRGQANFRGLEASRPRPSTSKCVLETSSRPRTSSRTPPLIGSYILYVAKSGKSPLRIISLCCKRKGKNCELAGFFEVKLSTCYRQYY